MKIGLLAICILLFSGCDEETNTGRYFKGNHNLLALNSGTSMRGHVSGEYFLFVGGMSGSFKQENLVKFIWENNRGEYIPSVLPYSKIRFVFSETETPSVKFRWAPSSRNYSDIMDYIVYAVFTLRPNQIKSDINFDIGK